MTPAIGRARHDLLASLLLLTLLPALGMSLAFCGVLRCGSGCQLQRARLDLSLLARALVLHQQRQCALPRPEVGLRALVEAGVVEQVPLDPWGHPYRYEVVGDSVRISTLGADGAPGGREEDADLSVWRDRRRGAGREAWRGPSPWPPAYLADPVEPGWGP